MRAYDDILIFQPLVLSGNHGDDVMSGALFVLPVSKVVIITSYLLAFDNGLEFHAAQLADDELRSECIAMSSRIACRMSYCRWACICKPKAIAKDKSHIFLIMNPAYFKFGCKGTTIFLFRNPHLL